MHLSECLEEVKVELEEALNQCFGNPSLIDTDKLRDLTEKVRQALMEFREFETLNDGPVSRSKQFLEWPCDVTEEEMERLCQDFAMFICQKEGLGFSNSRLGKLGEKEIGN